MSNYSTVDRALHRLAFAHPSVQLILAEVSRSALAKGRHVPPDRPVFVSSLPRAGTTALLEALATLPQVGTHRYRDMPFVLAPELWARLSGRFRNSQNPRERAHGDGIAISVDSPEAFEEVAWRAFWPAKYQADRISLWSESDWSDEAYEFLAGHIAEVISVRRAEKPGACRYVSKNNANICRIPLLERMFPQGFIVVPLRNPIDQAISLRRQHANFERIHRKDRFSVRYMRDLGHYEFGALHRPIDFPGRTELMGDLLPDNLDYWLAYWIVAYEHVLRFVEHLTIVDCGAVFSSSNRVANLLDMIGFGYDASVAARLRKPPAYEEPPGTDPTLVRRAQEIYARLAAHSV